jgi:hypothetical protein
MTTGECPDVVRFSFFPVHSSPPSLTVLGLASSPMDFFLVLRHAPVAAGLGDQQVISTTSMPDSEK